jgi:Protein of unknown function (DUF3106)
MESVPTSEAAPVDNAPGTAGRHSYSTVMTVSPQELFPTNRKSPVDLCRPILISAMAVILVAAATEYDASFERLQSMPKGERKRLLDNLRDFDLKLTAEQQAAVRDLDRRLSALSPEQRAQYRTVLRRYHAWLNSLPEQRQNELAAKPPGERTALIRKLIQDYPVPLGETPPILRVAEPGEYNPFEVASAYKIWQNLNEKQRADLEHVNAEHTRREALFRIGARPKKAAILRETTPHDFDEEKWIEKVKLHWGSMQSMVMLETLAKSKMDETVKKRVDALRPEIQRRQAINLYVSQAKVRSVDPERLTRFIAALPPWIPPSFDSLSPDEARRRLTFAYRLVFPEPEEIGAIRKPAGTANGDTTPVPKAATPPKANRKPAADGEGATPF